MCVISLGRFTGPLTPQSRAKKLDLVPDYATSVREGDFFGWPYSYYGADPQPQLDSRWSGDHPIARSPDYVLGSNTASLDIRFSHDSALPERWRNGLIVSQHGS